MARNSPTPSNIDEVEATSTNNEIFIVPIERIPPSGGPKKISTSPGSDSTPLYSPDGKYLAWRSQARAGFESDNNRCFSCKIGNPDRRPESHGEI